jgi:hypothetical protein
MFFFGVLGAQPASKCVCIRVWQSALASETQMKDKEILLWGIYFSGLTRLCDKENVILKPNSIVFKMYNEYYTSSDCFLNVVTDISTLSVDLNNHCEEIVHSFDDMETKSSFNGRHEIVYPVELKSSYSLKKLSSFQIKTRYKKYQVQKCKELSERICMKSVSN